MSTRTISLTSEAITTIEVSLALRIIALRSRYENTANTGEDAQKARERLFRVTQAAHEFSMATASSATGIGNGN